MRVKPLVGGSGLEDLFEPVQVGPVESRKDFEGSLALSKRKRITAVSEELRYAALAVQQTVHEQLGITDFGGSRRHVGCAV